MMMADGQEVALGGLSPPTSLERDQEYKEIYADEKTWAHARGQYVQTHCEGEESPGKVAVVLIVPEPPREHGTSWPANRGKSIPSRGPNEPAKASSFLDMGRLLRSSSRRCVSSQTPPALSPRSGCTSRLPCRRRAIRSTSVIRFAVLFPYLVSSGCSGTIQ